ncbi:radical SAM protein [bacterium]|nr:radical SAM protein [bacterium]
MRYLYGFIRNIKYWYNWLFDKPVVPESVSLELTYRCNARCGFCKRWKLPPKEELTLQDYKELADDMHLIGVKQVNLTGGEPFLREDIIFIIDLFLDKNIVVYINTNGVLLDKYSEEISKRKLSIKISIDSPFEETHDKIRGVKNFYKKAIDNLKSLKGKGVDISIGAVVCKENIDEMDEYIEFAKKLDTKLRFQPVHDDRLSNLSIIDPAFKFNSLDSERINKNFESVVKLFKKSPNPVWTDEIYYKLTPLFLTKPQQFLKIKCIPAGRLIYFIDPYGNVFPCESRRDIKFGNIRNEKFSDVIKNKKNKDFRKLMRKNKRDCVCWYRCIGPNLIRDQFLPLMNIPKTGGFPLKQLWNLKINRIKK